MPTPLSFDLSFKESVTPLPILEAMTRQFRRWSEGALQPNPFLHALSYREIPDDYYVGRSVVHDNFWSTTEPITSLHEVSSRSYVIWPYALKLKAARLLHLGASIDCIAESIDRPRHETKAFLYQCCLSSDNEKLRLRMRHELSVENAEKDRLARTMRYPPSP
jgi:hypothetical protein